MAPWQTFALAVRERGENFCQFYAEWPEMPTMPPNLMRNGFGLESSRSSLLWDSHCAQLDKSNKFSCPTLRRGAGSWTRGISYVFTTLYDVRSGQTFPALSLSLSPAVALQRQLSFSWKSAWFSMCIFSVERYNYHIMRGRQRERGRQSQVRLTKMGL